MPVPEVDWHLILSHLTHLAISCVLVFPIGWDRESHARGAGLRTLPLVAVTSCGYLLLGLEVLEGSESHARLLYGLMTGLGFIGGGTILKEHGSVAGTATAASVWNCGAIGAAVAWNLYEIAIVLAGLNFIVLRYSSSLKAAANGSPAES